MEALPSESATKTAIRDTLSPGELAEAGKSAGNEHGPWSHTDYLLRHILDRLSWVIFAVYRSQGGKPKQPEPFPGPGIASKDGPQEIAPEAADYFARLRREHAERQRKAAEEARAAGDTNGG